MTHNYYAGLDVHKETISIAYALEAIHDEPTYHGQCSGSIAAVTNTLQKLAERLDVDFTDLKVCYEAGPTGFVIARHLIKKGNDCVLMSPSRTERRPGDKIKTDKRDACNIARLFRNGDITQVRIPPVLDEAVRDDCRRVGRWTTATLPLSIGSPRLVDFSFPTRWLQSPRGAHRLHTSAASPMMAGFVQSGRLAAPTLCSEAESSSIASRLAGSPHRGFALGITPFDAGLPAC